MSILQDLDEALCYRQEICMNSNKHDGDRESERGYSKQEKQVYTHTSLLLLMPLLLSTSGACHFLSSMSSASPGDPGRVLLR